MTADASARQICDCAEMRQHLLTRTQPYSPGLELPFSLENACYMELLETDNVMYQHMMTYLPEHVTCPRSMRLRWEQSTTAGKNEEDDDEDLDALGERAFFSVAASAVGPGHGKKPTSGLGLGLHEVIHEFADGIKRKIFILFQALGQPVGTDTNADFFYSMILFVEGDDRPAARNLLQEFLTTVWTVSTKVNKARVAIWRFDIIDSYWRKVSTRKPRDFSLVILDKEVKKTIVEDLSWFLKKETTDFYARHGIPYHRAYLFHGPPGAGKTSTIFAIAGEFERNLCFIQSDVEMTDDKFRSAVGTAPQKSMIVMEDVDALFTVHRDTDSKHSSLTFSGFLNSIDGLASPEDIVFVLTTNHPSRLDPALLRPGRVDVRVAFTPPNHAMAREYFLTFYDDEEAASVFAKNVSSKNAMVSMAQMQHYFLDCHRHNRGAKDASEVVRDFEWQKPLGREEVSDMYR